MDFLSGALPNVMFIAGLIAIGIALGLEFKIVEVKGNLSKFGRIATFGVGSILVAVSVFLYTRPSAEATAPATPVPAPTTVAAAPESSATATAVPTTVAEPTATAESSASTDPTVTPSAAPAETDPLAELRTLLAAAVADKRISQGAADVIKYIEELETAIAKPDAKRSKDRLNDLYSAMSGTDRKVKVDAEVAAQATTLIEQIASRYDIEISTKKP